VLSLLLHNLYSTAELGVVERWSKFTRTKVPRPILEEVIAGRDEIASETHESLNAVMQIYGYEIMAVTMKDIKINAREYHM
jgi:regulator of protease activity HflC (stomatin/prohibitin superfamily)